MDEQQPPNYGIVLNTTCGWEVRPRHRCGLPSIAVDTVLSRPLCPEHVKATMEARKGLSLDLDLDPAAATAEAERIVRGLT